VDDQEYERLKMTAYQIIKESKNVDQLKQALAFILPVAHQMDIDETAKVLGFSNNWVSQLRSRFVHGKPLKHGARGGRHHAVMSVEQERQFVVQYREKHSLHQQHIDAKSLKAALEDHLGKSISTSYVYSFIRRNKQLLQPASLSAV
jgi:transposase